MYGPPPNSNSTVDIDSPENLDERESGFLSLCAFAEILNEDEAI